MKINNKKIDINKNKQYNKSIRNVKKQKNKNK